jgi:electron transport complex protein RnfC
VPVHASSSGTVIAIEERAVPHPSGLRSLCVVIETDGEDRWTELAPERDWPNADPSHLRNRVREAGIVGLGGAGFPSYIKLNPGSHTAVDTLILNGAECEPYITCDDMLMRERADQVIAGLRIMSHALQARHNVIAIEDNKSHAIRAMREAMERAGRSDVELVVVPTRYPTGGEKQLIKVVTGKEVPSQGLPINVGVVCHNVATAASIYRAVELGEPLITRIVTVSGGAIAQPRNLETRIGTAMAELLEFAGGTRSEPARYVMGGPMMGITLPTLHVPVTKTTNCLLAPLPGELGDDAEATPCIRCGACAEACPVSLLPQQLYWHARAKDFDKAQDYKLFDCIECGCCAYVCPSHLPLVQYYRFAKTSIWAQERDKKKADLARQRHEFRQSRQEQEKAEREAKLRQKKAAEADGAASPEDAKKAAIQAALERAKAKKASAAVTEEKPEE